MILACFTNCFHTKFFYIQKNPQADNSKGKLGNTDPEIIWTPSDFSNMKKF